MYADSSVCSAVSTAQGPAMNVNVSGPIGTPLAALSVSEPAVAVVLAVTALHERLPTAVLIRLVGAVGITLAIAGVLVLARLSRSRAGTAPR